MLCRIKSKPTIKTECSEEDKINLNNHFLLLNYMENNSGVAEWFIATVCKTVIQMYHGFESHLLSIFIGRLEI